MLPPGQTGRQTIAFQVSASGTQRTRHTGEGLPGAVWSPLILSTMPPAEVRNFGKQLPMGRPPNRPNLGRRPSDAGNGSHISGAMITVTRENQSARLRHPRDLRLQHRKHTCPERVDEGVLVAPHMVEVQLGGSELEEGPNPLLVKRQARGDRQLRPDILFR